MTARALWKGTINIGELQVPVKLYSALEDRSIHFRLLHRKDKQPVQQQLISADSGEIVPYAESRRAFSFDTNADPNFDAAIVDHDEGSAKKGRAQTGTKTRRKPQPAPGSQVLLDQSELQTLAPPPSRDINIRYFLPAALLDHRWYHRPYYLGPDGDEAAYNAMTKALDSSGREGLAQWVMRDKSYIGLLRLYQGYPMLISLRFADEIIPLSSLQAPTGRELAKAELDMAAQLIEMLAADFAPEQYRDSYRERVLELIETKARGGNVKRLSPRPRPRKTALADALAASLKQQRKSA